MPKRTDISSILIIGAGPIVIGQACEFDYSGTQACKALRAEGYRIVLVNSNPATIMTDPDVADATYVEPITPDIVAKIIEKERPDALLPTMGGQTALNCALSLRRMGVLDKFGVAMIGATAEAIDMAEDRELFREAMKRIGLETPKSSLANASDLKKADRALQQNEIAAIKARKLAGRGGAARDCGVRGRLGRRRGRAQAALYRQGADRGARSPRIHRHTRDHPAVFYACRHRRRHRFQQGGVPGDRRARPRRFADHRGVDRRERARLERIRDGGRSRQTRQLHHRLLHREPRSDGGAHRRFHHRRAGTDADRQGIPDHARRLDRGAARDRGGDRRLERAVRRQSCGRPPRRHRDEPARVALIRACLEGDRIPDRQSRRQACRRLHARRDRERHHRRRNAGIVRADHRLRGDEGPALRLREISRCRAGAHHVDEVGRRSDGDRPHLPGIAAEGVALAGDGPHRPRRNRDQGTGRGRRQERHPRGARRADA